jgi:uroporphyrin-III C-methyltransferase
MDYPIDPLAVFNAMDAPQGSGSVALVGAGPGDPELLTVRALERIRAAQAIVHDALIPAGIHALFPTDCALYDVGKRKSNDRSADQDGINMLLVRLARQGLRVVRLKGGDPFVFGRGGEEAAVLQAHGIPHEVVPAVTAFLGAGAAASIPLTHRHVSHACTVLEGHEAGLDRIHWQALVALGGTWVFYMAKSTVAEIATRLIAHGAAAELPLAVIENATLPDQVLTVLTLGTATQGYAPLTPGPGLVIVSPTIGVLHQPAALRSFLDDTAPVSRLSELGA